MRSHQSGFSLLEVLLSVTIIGIISGFSLPVFRGMLLRHDLSIAVTTSADVLRKSYAYSTGGVQDSAWGVRFVNNQVIIFKGQNFAGRDVNADEIYFLAGGVSVSGTQEYVFQKLTGITTAGNTVINKNGEGAAISITQKGIVSYE